MTATIAIGLPHAPWISERRESFSRLIGDLGVHGSNPMLAIFNERESNRVWSQKLFRWALDTGASHLLQLQDDAIIAPNFWPVLHAMIEAQPNRIIGLEAAHPLGPIQYRAGRRWYRTRAWLIGVGYVFPRMQLAQFVAWCDLNPERVASTNEDSLISQWAAEHGIDIWHPVPTIIDHDLAVPSTYGNDTHYEWSLFRKPTVTWRDIQVDPGALESVDYWRASIDAAPLLPGPGTELCWYCNTEQGTMTSPLTGARIGKQCVANILSSILSRA